MSIRSLLTAFCSFGVLALLGFTPVASAQTSAAPVPSASTDPLDWPNWRGPEQNGISRETGLIDNWSLDGENVLWKKPGLGTRSSPIVMRGKVYYLARSEPGTHQEGEKVVCLDAATGDVKWENKFNVFLSDVPDTRVGWSSCVGDPATGRVYAMGVCGYFLCVDGETGKTLWDHSLSEEFGLLSTYGGRTNVPVLFEDLVIISAVMTNWGDLAIPAHRFVAFDKATGKVVWFNGTRLRPDDTTYSTPTLAVLGGQAAMVLGSGDGAVWAIQPRTGVPIWNCQFSLRGLNVSPLVDGDTVYMGQSEENFDDNGTMGAIGAINGIGKGDITKTNFVWRNKQQMAGKCSPLLVDGKLYFLDDGNTFYRLDPATGKSAGPNARLVGTISRSSPVYADGKIYASTISSWHVLAPSASGVKIVHRLRFPPGEEIHASPAVSHGRIYFATTDCMYCLGKEGAKPQATPRPAPKQEAKPSDHPDPAYVQIVPAESLIKPGEKIAFKARLFNDQGQFLKDAEAKFSVSGGGKIDAQGNFVADPAASHEGVIVTASVGELAGKARIRIVPALPWKFDFNEVALKPNPNTKVPEGDPPITWIGARYRHVVRDIDGEKVMVKVTTIPKGTRSQSWMGPIDLHDFTIQADVMGGNKNGKMPDIGLIGQRYTLDLMGSHQKLQIRSWTAVLDERFAKDVPYAWESHKWYTLKFRTAVEDGKAVLRGKVWPRGTPEPEAWTIEATDDAPNLVGSPGLFGNAGEAEIYLDHITVTANTK